MAMEMTALCLGKLAKTASFPHSHSFGDDLGFPFSPNSFNFNFNEKCYLHARYLLLPTCPFAQAEEELGFRGCVRTLLEFGSSPEATFELSPGRQSWVDTRNSTSPVRDG